MAELQQVVLAKPSKSGLIGRQLPQETLVSLWVTAPGLSLAEGPLRKSASQTPLFKVQFQLGNCYGKNIESPQRTVRAYHTGAR